MSNNLAYQDDTRIELINGEVTAMSPRPSFNHNRIASNVYWAFENYLRHKRCTAIADGTDLYLTEKERFVPDMMVVCDRDKIQHDGVHGAPDLVVEVLSPGTLRNDRGHKKDIYARCGVREYWIVNPADKSVEIYRADGSDLILYDIYALHPDWELRQMTDEERAALVTQFKCNLFDDLDIFLDDIFSGLLP